MRKALRYIAIPVIAALLITGATYLVTLWVAGYSVSGFPVPYVTFHPCCSVTGDAATGTYVSYDNTYFYQPLNFAVDFAIWLAISLAVVSTITVRRLLVATAAGAVLTSATLLVSPLSLVAPTPGLETGVLRAMGFPYEYLDYYVIGLPGIRNPSGYEFFLPPLLADLALWTGMVFTAFGLAVAFHRRTHRQKLLSSGSVP